MGQDLSQYVPKLSLVNIIHADFMYHRHHLILAIDSLVKQDWTLLLCFY
jgi:hypothetical protein